MEPNRLLVRPIASEAIYIRRHRWMDNINAVALLTCHIGERNYSFQS